MDNRLVATVAVALAAAAAGCSSPPAALGGTTAKVTINGQSTGDPHAVRCSQTGWAWTIETPDEAKGFTAVVDTGDTVTASRSISAISVASRAPSGRQHRQSRGDRRRRQVHDHGSADGSFTDNPSNAVTATFRSKPTAETGASLPRARSKPAISTLPSPCSAKTWSSGAPSSSLRTRGARRCGRSWRRHGRCSRTSAMCARSAPHDWGRDHALVFEARVGDKQLEGCDFIQLDEDGAISEFTVMVRPLSARCRARPRR